MGNKKIFISKDLWSTLTFDFLAWTSTAIKIKEKFHQRSLGLLKSTFAWNIHYLRQPEHDYIYIYGPGLVTKMVARHKLHV